MPNSGIGAGYCLRASTKWHLPWCNLSEGVWVVQHGLRAAANIVFQQQFVHAFRLHKEGAWKALWGVLLKYQWWPSFCAPAEAFGALEGAVYMLLAMASFCTSAMPDINMGTIVNHFVSCGSTNQPTIFKHKPLNYDCTSLLVVQKSRGNAASICPFCVFASGFHSTTNRN